MIAVSGADRRRRTAGVGVVAVAAALLTSCAAGRVAQTINQRPTIDGVNSQVGSIAIRNLAIDAPDDNSFPKGSALRLTGVFVNNGTSSDVLTDISSPSVTSWGAYSSINDGDRVVAAAGAPSTSAAVPKPTLTVRVPAGSRASYGVPDATGSLLVLGTKATIYPGSTVPLTLTFARAGTVTVQVPVQITTDPTQATLPAPGGTDASN